MTENRESEARLTLIAQIFHLMNSWAELDMKRDAGVITVEQQSAEMSAKVMPLALAWDQMIDEQPLLPFMLLLPTSELKDKIDPIYDEVRDDCYIRMGLTPPA